MPLVGTNLDLTSPFNTTVYSCPPANFALASVPRKRAMTPEPDHANFGPAVSLVSTRPTKRTAGGPDETVPPAPPPAMPPFDAPPVTEPALPPVVPAAPPVP